MPALTELLLKTLAPPVANALFKHWMQNPALELSQGIRQFLSDGSSAGLSAREQLKLQRLMEELAAGVVEKLEPLFAEAEAAHLNAEAVVQALGTTLETPTLATTMLQADLQPEAVVRLLEQRQPHHTATFAEAERELYQRALRLAVPCLVALANRLPGFTVAQAQASLTRLTDLAEGVDTLLQAVQPLPAIAAGVHELVAQQRDQAQRQLSAAQAYERDYLAAVRRRLNTFDLLGIADPEDTQERLELTVAYIPLRVTQRRAQTSEASDLALFDTLLDRLSPKRPGLIIEGPAGSGKTTLLRWAAIQAGQEASVVTHSTRRRWHKSLEEESRPPEAEEPSWRQLIPFFIRLRDCHDGHLPAIAGYPQHLQAPELAEPPAGWVETLLRRQRALILWDGADEIPPTLRRTMLQDMRGMMQSYPGNYAVLSTRPGVRIAWAEELGVQQADIVPMARPDIEQFVTHWHMAAAKVVSPSRAAELPQTSTALLRQLDNEPAVLRLATNPLLCSAICTLHYLARGYLPDQQHLLCEELCKMLLHDRDRQRGALAEDKAAPETPLTYMQKKRLVQHLASEMVQSGRSAVTREEARRLVAQQLPRFDSTTAPDGAAVLQRLLERSGLLRAYQGDSIEFVHNTLKEYLAAEECCTGLVDRLVQGALGAARRKASLAWHNVAVFAAALGSEAFAEDLIRQILAQPVEGPAHARPRQILALRCMAAATRLPEALRRQQRELEHTLFPPRTLTEAAHLAAAGEPVIRFLRPPSEASAGQLAACVHALRLIGTEAVRAVLRDYLHSRQKEVLDELVQAVNPLEIPMVVEWAQRWDQLPESYRSYIRDVQPLLGYSGLQRLWLDKTVVSDVGPLAKLTNLQELGLSGTQVHDVKPLAQLARLRTLSLSGTQVRDVKPLEQLTSLHTLWLDGTQVHDVRPLAQLANLHTLWLHGTQVHDVRPLAQLANLQVLSLSKSQVRDVGPLANRRDLRIHWFQPDLYAGPTLPPFDF